MYKADLIWHIYRLAQNQLKAYLFLITFKRKKKKAKCRFILWKCILDLFWKTVSRIWPLFDSSQNLTHLRKSSMTEDNIYSVIPFIFFLRMFDFFNKQSEQLVIYILSLRLRIEKTNVPLLHFAGNTSQEHY